VTLSVGNKIVYPYQGPCLIGAVVTKLIGGIPTSFYRLALLDDSGGELFVPVEKISSLGVRQLMERCEVPALLSHLTRSAATPTNVKDRASANMKLLTSGSAFDLAQLIESLTELNEIRGLLPWDRQALDKARRMLICEISEVMGETKSAAKEEVDRALKVRIGDQAGRNQKRFRPEVKDQR
jgi:RNA polymerase-interacting CarD/CdnL/TRCF family regulator